MNRYTLTIGITLLLLVAGLPIYASLEPARLDAAQADLQHTYVAEATELYGTYCAVCHGPAGEGIATTPALDSDALRGADYNALFQTIAFGISGSTMVGWHQDMGGPLNDYQIDALVALIRYGSWSDVQADIVARDVMPPVVPVAQVDPSLVDTLAALGPEGSRWADGLQTYATNCTVCHGVDGAGTTLGVALNTPDLRAMETAELTRLVTDGVAGTLMAGWEGTLGQKEIGDVVAFLQNWDQVDNLGIILPTPAPIMVNADDPEAMLALGERLYATTCVACHGAEGSGGIGPVLNSQQVLTGNDDAALADTIINGGHRPNSQMPAFGDRLSSIEVDALVAFLRAWEPDAPWVENPRGTAQGGGPAWLRSDGTTAADTAGGGNGSGGPWWASEGGSPPGQASQSGGAAAGQGNAAAPTDAGQLSAAAAYYSGTVAAIDGNMLTLTRDDGTQVEAMLGPPWFWSEQGILIQAGDLVELEGFYSADHMEVNWINNLTRTTGKILRVDGQPVWRAGG